MSIDVVDLRNFYAHRLGTVARHFIGRGIRHRWGDTQGLRVLGMGYTTPYLGVFRVAGTTAFIAYAAGLWQQSIWYSRPWSTTLKHTLDGLIYALLTGGAFGWLWPAG